MAIVYNRHYKGYYNGRYTREEAAIRVLRLRKQPMTPSQIVEMGARNGFFENSSRAIVASTNVALHKAARRTEPPVFQLGDGRYGLPEWGMLEVQLPDPADTSPHPPVRRPRVNHDMNQRLGERMKDVEDYLKGMAALNPERVCLLIGFCHLLDLHREVVDLYARLPKNEVDPAWLKRVERLVRVSRQYISPFALSEQLPPGGIGLPVSPFLSKRGGAHTLEEILEVAHLVILVGRGYWDAVEEVAQRRSVRPSTVNAKCTRELGMDAWEFKRLLGDKDGLVSVLAERFGFDRQVIEERIHHPKVLGP